MDTIPDALWHPTVEDFPFLARRPIAEQQALRSMAAAFLAKKQFTGAGGLVINDPIAVAIAAQACLPVLHLGLRFYDDFKGIVVHPGPMLASREVTDDNGIVHHYKEALSGEAMDHGPVTLSWADVAASGESAEAGYNVVIHEFAHKIDMRDGLTDGCPPMPSMAARAMWQEVFEPAYDAFCEKVTLAERFGGQPTWLDPYGAESAAEFFAVACEGFYVNPARFAQDFPTLNTLFARYFQINAPVA
ncbi:MAG: zinc-dependent peptidase [Polaromonas sp.]|nr:zinc-dependent peptidase [Polaromonas sp.]